MDILDFSPSPRLPGPLTPNSPRGKKYLPTGLWNTGDKVCFTFRMYMYYVLTWSNALFLPLVCLLTLVTCILSLFIFAFIITLFIRRFVTRVSAARWGYFVTLSWRRISCCFCWFPFVVEMERVMQGWWPWSGCSCTCLWLTFLCHHHIPSTVVGGGAREVR